MVDSNRLSSLHYTLFYWFRLSYSSFMHQTKHNEKKIKKNIKIKKKIIWVAGLSRAWEYVNVGRCQTKQTTIWLRTLSVCVSCVYEREYIMFIQTGHIREYIACRHSIHFVPHLCCAGRDGVAVVVRRRRRAFRIYFHFIICWLFICFCVLNKLYLRWSRVVDCI